MTYDIDAVITASLAMKEAINAVGDHLNLPNRILYEQERRGEPLSYQQIDCAVKNLYGGWEKISEYAIQFLKTALDSENLTELFMEQEREEALSKQVVLRVQKYDKEKMNESNVDAIIQRALSRKKNDRDVR